MQAKAAAEDDLEAITWAYWDNAAAYVEFGIRTKSGDFGRGGRAGQGLLRWPRKRLRGPKQRGRCRAGFSGFYGRGDQDS